MNHALQIALSILLAASMWAGAGLLMTGLLFRSPYGARLGLGLMVLAGVGMWVQA